MLEIRDALEGWAPDDYEMAIYEEWALHSKYPYAGGMLDQPQWWFELRRRCGLMDEWHRLNNGLKEAK